jgi:hypothetical protein
MVRSTRPFSLPRANAAGAARSGSGLVVTAMETASLTDSSFDVIDHRIADLWRGARFRVEERQSHLLWRYRRVVVDIPDRCVQWQATPCLSGRSNAAGSLHVATSVKTGRCAATYVVERYGSRTRATSLFAATTPTAVAIPNTSVPPLPCSGFGSRRGSRIEAPLILRSSQHRFAICPLMLQNEHFDRYRGQNGDFVPVADYYAALSPIAETSLSRSSTTRW